MNNTLGEINSRITKTEGQINDPEDRMVEIIATEHNIEKRILKNEVWDLWDNIKCTNIHIIGVSEGEERERGPEKIFEEIIAEHFLNVGKEKVNQVQEALRSPGWINPRRNSPRHTAIKQRKIKDRILKSAREKGQITYKGTPIRLSAYFSTETLQARREWHNIFKVMKGKNLQPRILHPMRLSFNLMEKSKVLQTIKG